MSMSISEGELICPTFVVLTTNVIKLETLATMITLGEASQWVDGRNRSTEAHAMYMEAGDPQVSIHVGLNQQGFDTYRHATRC